MSLLTVTIQAISQAESSVYPRLASYYGTVTKLPLKGQLNGGKVQVSWLIGSSCDHCRMPVRQRQVSLCDVSDLIEAFNQAPPCWSRPKGAKGNEETLFWDRTKDHPDGL